ncbi:MAG: hypothetical protein SVU88_02195 [Candidatus Nanohaloarchaea archaeon]|nr:hypothetical protein [Candidatus Nanohaloarchaea archaeon]
MDITERWEALNERMQAVLNDPEAVFTAVKTLTGLGIGLSIASVSFAFAMVFIRQGRTLLLFAALALFWSGYLFAHYTATGQLIHQHGSGRALPRDRYRAASAVLGVLLLLAGLTAVPLPAVKGDILNTSLAALAAAAGYVLAHYGLTDSLL